MIKKELSVNFLYILASLFFSIDAYCETRLYESSDESSPVISLVVELDKGVVRSSYAYRECYDYERDELIEVKNGSISFENDSVDVPLKSLDEIPHNEELLGNMFLGKGVESKDNPYCGFTIITTETPEKLLIHYFEKNEANIISKHYLSLVTDDKISKKNQDIIKHKMNKKGIDVPQDESFCLSLTGKSCEEISKINDELVGKYNDGDYYFLPPQWRVPRFADEQGGVVSDAVNEDPYIQLDNPLDFKKLVKLSKVWCKDDLECPKYLGLLMVLGESNEASQCSAQHTEKEGWFSTNAHCIPEDLRTPDKNSTKDCSERMFIKFPKNSEGKSLTFECDKIKYVSKYDEQEKSHDVAYFTVKDPSQLLKSVPTLDFDFTKQKLKESKIHSFVVNPVKDMQGLNGEIQKKSCSFKDIFKYANFFPEVYRDNAFDFITTQECDFDYIPGNSGSAMINAETGLGIGWAQAISNFYRVSAYDNLIEDRKTSFNVDKFFLGTPARCFTEASEGMAGEIIEAHSENKGCSVISNDEIDRRLLAYEASVMNSLLKNQKSRLSNIISDNNVKIYQLERMRQDSDREIEKLTEDLFDEREALARRVKQLDGLYMRLNDFKDKLASSQENALIAKLVSRQVRPKIAVMSKGIFGVKGSIEKISYRNFEAKLELCVNPVSLWADQFLKARYFDGVTGKAYPLDAIEVSIKAPVAMRYNANISSGKAQALFSRKFTQEEIEKKGESSILKESHNLTLHISPIGRSYDAGMINKYAKVGIYLLDKPTPFVIDQCW